MSQMSQTSIGGVSRFKTVQRVMQIEPKEGESTPPPEKEVEEKEMSLPSLSLQKLQQQQQEKPKNPMARSHTSITTLSPLSPPPAPENLQLHLLERLQIITPMQLSLSKRVLAILNRRTSSSNRNIV